MSKNLENNSKGLNISHDNLIIKDTIEALPKKEQLLRRIVRGDFDMKTTPEEMMNILEDVDKDGKIKRMGELLKGHPTHIKSIPIELISEDLIDRGKRSKEQMELAKEIVKLVENKDGPLSRLTQLGEMIPKLDPKTLDSIVEGGNTLRFTLAQSAFINFLPPGSIREEYLYEQNENGESLAHILARMGKLELYPGFKPNADIMALKNKNGDNVLHAAYLAKKEDKLPKYFKVEGPAFVEDGGKMEIKREFFRLKDIAAYTMANKDDITPKNIHDQKDLNNPKKSEEEPSMT
jgi:ankyrin repeat protein